MAEGRELESRRVEEGVLFHDSERTMSASCTIPGKKMASVILQPAASVGVVTVGIEVKSSVESVRVLDIKVGKNSQTACVGEFSYRLLDGRLAFRLDEIYPMGINLAVTFYNREDQAAEVGVTAHFDEASLSDQRITLYPTWRDPESAKLQGRTQIGGDLFAVLIHPDFFDAIESEALKFEVTVHDLDPHPDLARAMERARRLGDLFDVSVYRPHERPGTRRTVPLTSTSEKGWLALDRLLPIWVGENTILEVLGSPPRPVTEADFVFLLDVDRTGFLSSGDSPRYDGHLIGR